MALTRTLARYVLADMTRPTLVALGVMLGLIWLLQSLRFLDMMINKGLGVGVFFHLTLLLVPMLLTIILPLGVFVGCCYAFRRWQDDNELTAVLASGRSARTVLAPALFAAGVAVVFGYALYFYILPWSMGAFKDLQVQIRNQDGQLLLEEGTFNTLGNNLMVYLKKRTSETTLESLLVHDERKPDAPVTWFARYGEISRGADGYPQLILKDGLRQEIGKNEVSMLEFARYNLDIREKLGEQVLAPRKKEREEYSLREMRQMIAGDDAKQRFAMMAELNKRLLWPLTPLPLVMLAAAWLLRAPRRHTSSVRLLVGAGVGAVLYQSGLVAAYSLLQGGQMLALAAQWLLPVATVAFALWLGRKERIFG